MLLRPTRARRMMKPTSAFTSALVISVLAFACSSEPAEPSEAPEEILDEPGTSDPALPDGEDDPGAPHDGEVPAGEAADGGVTDGGAPDPPAPSGPLQIWMSPTGSDSNDGLTAAKAVTSLARVQAILVARHGTKPWDRDVEVRIAPGRYVGQTVTWTHTSPTRKITFMPAADDKNRPVFDGCSSDTNCVTGSFFRLSSSAGAKTNLAFEYLKVIRYRTAFSFDGNRNDAKKYNGGNRIYGCWLEDIGNGHAAGLEPSTAAVRLVNSDHNTIRHRQQDQRRAPPRDLRRARQRPERDHVEPLRPQQRRPGARPRLFERQRHHEEHVHEGRHRRRLHRLVLRSRRAHRLHEGRARVPLVEQPVP